MNYLIDHDSASIDFIVYQQQWLGTPTQMELKDQAVQWSAQMEIADTPNNWQKIADTPNNGHINPLYDDTPS
jgi:hypothetical protein